MIGALDGAPPQAPVAAGATQPASPGLAGVGAAAPAQSDMAKHYSRQRGFSEVELYPITSRLPTFEVGAENDNKFGLPKVAKRGSSLKQGPHISLSCGWIGSVHGLEYIQLYLWLVKDWSWSQLHWVYPGIIFGCMAVAWSLMLFMLAASARLYSEAYLAVGMILWLGANFVWMVGEFWNENFIESDEDDEVDVGEVFYETCLSLAQVLAAGATAMLALYFLVLLPIGFFDYERRTNPIMARLCDDAPPPRFRMFFSTFREYETLHLLFWAIKDMCWVYNWPHLYVLGFAPTLLLNLDLMYLFATYRDQFLDFVHCVVLFFWVLANGVWAYGEMYVEEPPEGVDPDDFIPEEDWDSYDWPAIPDNTLFLARYAAGWLFCTCAVVLGAFYVHWLIVTIRCPPIEADDDEDDWDHRPVRPSPSAHDHSFADTNWEHTGGDRVMTI